MRRNSFAADAEEGFCAAQPRCPLEQDEQILAAVRHRHRWSEAATTTGRRTKRIGPASVCRRARLVSRTGFEPVLLE